jgi:hypothetical protein
MTEKEHIKNQENYLVFDSFIDLFEHVENAIETIQTTTSLGEIARVASSLYRSELSHLSSLFKLNAFIIITNNNKSNQPPFFKIQRQTYL